MQIKDRIETEQDFVNLRRMAFSLEKTIERYPEGDIPDRIAAQALGLKEEEIEPLFQAVVLKLRKLMHVQL